MSKKNSKPKWRKYQDFLIRTEKRQQEQEAKNALKRVAKNPSEVNYEKKRQEKSKRPKVPAVVSSDIKRKKLLAKQLKGLSLGSKQDKKKKVADSDSSDSDDEERDQVVGMDIDMGTGQGSSLSKGIQKQKIKVHGKAYYTEMKKVMKRAEEQKKKKQK